MVSPSRKFFVGGNFKMNGTVQMITDLVSKLNAAKLDGKTGELACRTRGDSEAWFAWLRDVWQQSTYGSDYVPWPASDALSST